MFEASQGRRIWQLVSKVIFGRGHDMSSQEGMHGVTRLSASLILCLVIISRRSIVPMIVFTRLES